MSKNRETKRRRKMQKKRSRQQASPKRRSVHHNNPIVPSAQTMWRTMHLDFRVQETLVATTMEVQPSLWKRDAAKIERIELAADVEAVLDLAPGATGLADHAWLKRMRAFGPGAANAIVERLDSDWMRSHAGQRNGIQERLIGALRWCDDETADALMRCWDKFDDYGRSLASVVFGLVDAQAAADRLWAFYQTMRSLPGMFFIGPLWGLIDLGDRRAADALLELTVGKRLFYEKYGFLARAGDRRVVLPLIAEVLDNAEETRADAMWALTGVAHRVGRDGLYLELTGGSEAQETNDSKVESFVDRLFLYSQEDVERHFESFYDKTAASLVTHTKNLERQH
jgi:hypothetical protein